MNRLNDLMTRQKKHIVRDTVFAMMLLLMVVLGAAGVALSMPAMGPRYDVTPAPQLAVEKSPGATMIARLLAPTSEAPSKLQP